MLGTDLRSARGRGRRRVVGVALLGAVLAAGAPSFVQDSTIDLPLVWVLATGGTIAGQGESPTSTSVYKPGEILGEDLVKAVPEIRQYANVKIEQVSNINSGDITFEHWLTLTKRIDAILRDDPAVAGIVVTHGTNTLEETAYFLNLTVRHDRPVVVVGAQRPATAISADGPLNLLNAIRTAATPEARGKGVLVVMNDEINSARDATKTNTYRVETFRSPELGFLGYVDADKVSFYRASTRRHTSRTEFDVSQLRDLPKVDIVYTYAQPTTDVIQALVASGVKGLVFAGTGAGALTTSQRAALKAIPEASRPVLVRSSRVGNGRVIALTAPREEYAALGVIPGDNLNPQKARILLMLALTKTTDQKEIERIFAEY
jgi:L-asparaginase